MRVKGYIKEKTPNRLGKSYLLLDSTFQHRMAADHLKDESHSQQEARKYMVMLYARDNALCSRYSVQQHIRLSMSIAADSQLNYQKVIF